MVTLLEVMITSQVTITSQEVIVTSPINEQMVEANVVLGTSTARSKIRSARSKICPLEERSCSKCSKKISLGFRSARYVLEKSCARARSARIFYARNARSALGMEHKKSIILDELFIVCSKYFFKIVPGHPCSR